CGETVLIARQYAYRGAELVVIPQPDGSVACIPAWMTHESAAHHQLRVEPRLSLNILRSLRAEIDALLGFLHSDSGMENANNEAQERKHSAGPVRAGRASCLAGSLAEGTAGNAGRNPAVRDRGGAGMRGGAAALLFTSASRRQISSCTIRRAAAVSTGSPIALGSSAGPWSRSSTMI